MLMLALLLSAGIVTTFIFTYRWDHRGYESWSQREINVVVGALGILALLVVWMGYVLLVR